MASISPPDDALAPRLRIGAVLLAAGEGRRMGGVAKALIRLQGVPLIRRQLLALVQTGVDAVVVVTGFARASVEAAVQGFAVTLVHNPDYALGQQGSVRAGLAALAGDFDAVLVLLADQPLIGAAELAELLTAFRQAPRRPDGRFVVPQVQGQRGNPVLLDARALARVLASPPDQACRELMDRHPELVHFHATDNVRFITDLDTREDVEALARRLGCSLELPPAHPVA